MKRFWAIFCSVALLAVVMLAAFPALTFLCPQFLRPIGIPEEYPVQGSNDNRVRPLLNVMPLYRRGCRCNVLFPE